MAAVKLMLARGAEFILSKSGTSFVHEALQNGRKDVVKAVIDSDKYVVAKPLSLKSPVYFQFVPIFADGLSKPYVGVNSIQCCCYSFVFLKNLLISSSQEALRLFIPGSAQRCPILDMIEFLPETYKVATD